MSIKYARQQTPVAMSCIDISLRHIAIQRESLLPLDFARVLLDCQMDLGLLSQRPDKWHENQADDEYQNQHQEANVSLGVARDRSNELHAVTYLPEQPVIIAGEVRERLTEEHYGFDPTLAPAGKSVIEVWLDSGYAYWKDLHDKREQYEAEKQQAANAVAGQLERHYIDYIGSSPVRLRFSAEASRIWS